MVFSEICTTLNGPYYFDTETFFSYAQWAGEKNAFNVEFDNNHLTSAFIVSDIYRKQAATMYDPIVCMIGKKSSLYIGVYRAFLQYRFMKLFPYALGFSSSHWICGVSTTCFYALQK